MNATQDGATARRPERPRPISFCRPMVRALVRPRFEPKSQARRVVRPQPGRWGELWRWAHMRANSQFPDDLGALTQQMVGACPYGRAGDKLWVREAFSTIAHGRGLGVRVRYEATPDARDQRVIDPALDSDDVWRPLAWQRHPASAMPPWLSRLTLELRGVRVERVQAITLADIMAEGIPQMYGEAVELGLAARDDGGTRGAPSAMDLWDNAPSRDHFARLWDRLHPTRGTWARDPFVWVLDFAIVGPDPRGAR